MCFKFISVSLLVGAIIAPLVSAEPDPERRKEPVTGMEFAAIPGGCFQMGSDRSVRPLDSTFFARIGVRVVVADDESPAHKVCLQPFEMAVYEVTQSQWQQLMGGQKGSEQQGMAVHGVSWQQASEFARRLTEKSAGEYHYRLPTEAEWEYACAAGQLSTLR